MTNKSEKVLDVQVSYLDFEIYFKISDLDKFNDDDRIYQIGYGEISSDISLALQNISDDSSEYDDLYDVFGEGCYEKLMSKTLDKTTLSKIEAYYDENYGATVKDIKQCLEDDADEL